MHFLGPAGRQCIHSCRFPSPMRGSFPRNNRIIRRYFPKGKSMAKVTQKDCDRVAALINAMPRKILNYETAADLFDRYIANLAENQD